MANRKPLQYPRYQAWADDETFLNGGTITFYDAGTTNQRNVYQDAALTTTAPNPVTLNSRGEPQSSGGTAIDIYLDNQAYKIVLADSTGTTKHTIDNYIETQDVLEPKDPADATDQSTDVFEGTLNSDPASGETFQVDFQTANTTTTPTFENTSGSLGAKTIKTRDGSALWSGALNGVHELQYDGTDYLLLDPALNSGGEYAASMDQGVATTDSPTFSNVTGSDTNFVTGTAGTDGNLAQWNADGDAVDGPDVLDEDNMASDSASAVPTQQSTKAYADTKTRIATGTYTGDGSTSQGITGVGFQPKYVKIWDRETTVNNNVEVFETTAEILDDTAAGGSVNHVGAGSHVFKDSRIISLDSDGFTVDDNGSDQSPNANGATYNYMAIG